MVSYIKNIIIKGSNIGCATKYDIQELKLIINICLNMCYRVEIVFDQVMEISRKFGK